MINSRPVFRFAPTPNGNLHLGHALSALATYDMAQRMAGRFLVRIEDIDLARCREEFVTGILDDLAWLGLSWEEPVLRQSEHFADYRAAAARLDVMGLLYPCFATRAEIQEAVQPGSAALDPDGASLYPGLHKAMPAEEITRRKQRGEPFAMRIHMDKALDVAAAKLAGVPLTFIEIDEQGFASTIGACPERWGDAVILRKDTPASYHLSVVIDDARQGVTHVTRGRDLFAATGLHRLLQVLLDLRPPVYHHHRLVLDPEGRKLSKSAADTSLKSLRFQGLSPAGVRQLIDLTAA